MTSEIISIPFSIADAIAEGIDVFSTITDGRNKTGLKWAEIVTKITHVFCSIVSAALNLGALGLFGRDISEITGKIASTVTRVSSVANCLQSGVSLFVQLGNGTPTAPDYLRFLGSTGVASMAVAPNWLYNIAMALTNNISCSWWISNTLEGGMRLIPHLPSLSSSCNRIATSVGALMSGSSDSSSLPTSLMEAEGIQDSDMGQGASDSPWTRLQNLMERNRYLPSDIEGFIEQCFIRQKLQRFICPISRRIIVSPLKHIESDVLFEKAVVDQLVSGNSTFSFSSNEHTYTMTRNSLVPSPGDQIQIARQIKKSMDSADKIFSNRQTHAERQHGTDPLTPRDVTALPREESAAFERLNRLWGLVSFVAIKSRVWVQLKREFDDINQRIDSRCFWWIDPRLYFVAQIKREVASAEVQHEAEFKGLINPQELVEKLTRIKNDSFIPGILSCNSLCAIFDSMIYERISKIPQLIDAMTVGVRLPR